MTAIDDVDYKVSSIQSWTEARVEYPGWLRSFAIDQVKVGEVLLAGPVIDCDGFIPFTPVMRRTSECKVIITYVRFSEKDGKPHFGNSNYIHMTHGPMFSKGITYEELKVALDSILREHSPQETSQLYAAWSLLRSCVVEEGRQMSWGQLIMDHALMELWTRRVKRYHSALESEVIRFAEHDPALRRKKKTPIFYQGEHALRFMETRDPSLIPGLTVA